MKTIHHVHKRIDFEPGNQILIANTFLMNRTLLYYVFNYDDEPVKDEFQNTGLHEYIFHEGPEQLRITINKYGYYIGYIYIIDFLNDFDDSLIYDIRIIEVGRYIESWFFEHYKRFRYAVTIRMYDSVHCTLPWRKRR